ncbi:MAG TPA: class I SAM-dependent methyltransferase [Tepidisphaeraceae bacterium]|nr:class I SAM-dependent methyltransferase [Tepidisphaeraceae bacterium]
MTTAAPRDFYDSEYHFAEDAARPDERRIWHALRHLQPLAGSDFFDLGCGAGWATRLAKIDGNARRAVGLDFSRTGLELARRHTPEVLWLQADGTALPLADASFDRLFCNGALEHFPDVRRGVAEIARVLRPGGRAVVIVPNFYVKTEQPMEFRASYWNWKRLFEQSQLTVVKTGTDWGPPVFKNTNLKRAAARLAGKALSALPYLQYQFIFVLGRTRG